MEQIIFHVQGSAEVPYRVTFTRRTATNLSAYCTCAAGENGQYCKHRFSILEGIGNAIVSANEHEVMIVTSWLDGTDVQVAMAKVAQLEKEAARIKRELTVAKQQVAIAMKD